MKLQMFFCDRLMHGGFLPFSYFAGIMLLGKKEVEIVLNLVKEIHQHARKRNLGEYTNY